jgi:hypothetical protein
VLKTQRHRNQDLNGASQVGEQTGLLLREVFLEQIAGPLRTFLTQQNMLLSRDPAADPSSPCVEEDRARCLSGFPQLKILDK